MESATATSNHSPAIRFLAHLFSIVFHPMFITSYVAGFLIFLHPYAFAGFDDRLKIFRWVMVVFNTAFIPGFSVFLMWRLGLIKSIYLKTTRERIIPYVAAMVCYFWAWLVVSRQPDNPEYFVNFMQGTFFAVCAAWMLNIYTKISMHTLAFGGAIVFFLLQAFHEYDTTGIYFGITLLIGGLVGTSRLIVSDHHPFQIYLGFIVGGLCQIVAVWL